MKKIIHTDKAPKALGPYSQAVVHNGLVYCSGQVGIDPQTGNFAGESVEAQCHQVMRNLGAVLQEAGSSFGQVLKCSIFLKDMDDFSVVNEIYGVHFNDEPPARETVAVKTLPKDAQVEISCIAIASEH
jgi:2-iminobutanoate/2-iminopropanoate deaminase